MLISLTQIEPHEHIVPNWPLENLPKDRLHLVKEKESEARRFGTK